jgi:hypothetical protein
MLERNTHWSPEATQEGHSEWRARDAPSGKRSLVPTNPDRSSGHCPEGNMKATISTLLVPLLGACIIALASCSGVPDGGAGVTDPSLGPVGDTVLADQLIAKCPQ